MDATPGVPTDYKDKDLDSHLQNKNLQHGRYGLGAKDVIYDRHVAPRDDPGYIWLGALVMAIGGFLAATDRRYRSKVPAAVQDTAGSPPDPQPKLGAA